MNKFHSTVSRRDFMKGLGLTGAGIGAASLVAPAFNDLDEMISAKAANYRRMPWFVQSREAYDFTSPHDWSQLTRHDQRHTNQCSWQGAKESSAWIDDRDGAGASAKQDAAKKAYLAEGLTQPRGWAGIRTNAYRNVINKNSAEDSPYGFMPPKVNTPESQKIPKWQGTPEENARMIKAGLEVFGACDVTFLELDDKTRNFVFTHDFHDGKPYVWEDVPVGYETGEMKNTKGPRAGKRVLANSAKWIINYQLQMSNDTIQNGLFDRRYGHGRTIQRQLQGWLNGLGYQAYGPVDYTNNFTQNVAFAILGGATEHMRSFFSAHPIYGASLGVGAGIITDLPLEPGTPIDAGLHRFCYECMKCAEVCPSGAISRNGNPNGPIIKEPQYEGIGPWSRWSGRTEFDKKHPELGAVNNGHNEYKGVNEPGFFAHWHLSPGDCTQNVGINICGSFGCGSRCVFSNGTEAMVHDVVKSTIAHTSIFNGFFKDMDGLFGFPMYNYGIDGPGVQEQMDRFWNYETNTPIYGIDTLRGGRRRI